MVLTEETVVTGPRHVLNETLIALTLHSAQPRCGVRGPAGVDYSDCASLASSSSTLGITSASHCLYWVFILFILLILFILFILVYPALVYNVCTGATLRHLLIPVTGASSARLSSAASSS